MDELAAYRRQILIGYTVAGVATSLICLFAITTDVLEEIPLPKAMAYLAVMVVPMCIGGIVARDVKTEDDSWSPLDHIQALKQEGPIAIGAIASILILDAGLYLAELPRLMVIPPFVVGWLANRSLRDR